MIAGINPVHTGPGSSEPLIEARALRKGFRQGGKYITALDDVSLQVGRGECYGLVGESGCGKSTLALSMLALQPVDSGSVLYRNEDLLTASKARLLELRREVRLLFQQPESVLNPGMTVKEILLEGLEREEGLTSEQRQARLTDALEQVRLGHEYLRRYPANLSSGEKQRVALGRALVTRPAFLILDEPVASLDLAIQSQVLGLLKRFQDELGLAYLFISHHLPMVKLLAHRIGIMYMGHLVEEAPTGDFEVERVRHPYARLLLASVPAGGQDHLKEVLAEYPDVEPVRLERGCPFRNRCPLYIRDPDTRCETAMPSLRQVAPSAKVACHKV